ncbi:hypothetical protein [Streptomyces decoyicus]|uniref:hypothetical protein n=1 Tax=Streptomyces decoyicus TaxID=249567 RepID=UPI0006624F31|nr:hypothetical protein [Streptomyces decoyicus]QZY14273.1 hypothetical protein K7C20_02665 [Streptomyces decoyicus]
MRTARTLFASAVITAVFAVTAPTAIATPAVEDSATVSATSAHGDGDDHHRRGDRDRDHHWYGHHRHHHCKHGHHRHHYRHHRPVGGMHTGGGAMR